MPRGARSAAPRLQCGDDFRLIRKAMLGVLRENLVTVDDHIERAARAGRERGFETELP
jgi:hypothetical protein